MSKRITKTEQLERFHRIRKAIEDSGGTLYFKYIPNTGLNTRRWYIFSTSTDLVTGKARMRDITLSVCRAFGFRFDEKRYAAIGHAFNNDASEFRERIRMELDLPTFEPTIIE